MFCCWQVLAIKQSVKAEKLLEIGNKVQELSCFGIALQRPKLSIILQGHWRMQQLRYALATLLARRSATPGVCAASAPERNVIATVSAHQSRGGDLIVFWLLCLER
jgi:hypothetical protein